MLDANDPKHAERLALGCDTTRSLILGMFAVAEVPPDTRTTVHACTFCGKVALKPQWGPGHVTCPHCHRRALTAAEGGPEIASATKTAIEAEILADLTKLKPWWRAKGRWQRLVMEDAIGWYRDAGWFVIDLQPKDGRWEVWFGGAQGEGSYVRLATTYRTLSEAKAAGNRLVREVVADMARSAYTTVRTSAS